MNIFILILIKLILMKMNSGKSCNNYLFLIDRNIQKLNEILLKKLLESQDVFLSLLSERKNKS